MTKKQPKKVDRPGVDRLGRTPLHYAASEGTEQAVLAQIAAGADVNAKDDNGWTPLHFAAQSDRLNVAKLLLEHGAEIDAMDDNGNTPLNNAVFSYVDNGALVELLRTAGANPTLENHHGVSALCLARDIGNSDVARLFADLP